MDDTFANIVPLAFLSDNELDDDEIEDIAEDEEEDFYDFIPFQQEFLMPLRDRAFSWDVSLEDGLHGENFHHAPSITMENGNPKLVIKAKRMSVSVKSESGTSVTIKSEKEVKATTDSKKSGSSKSGGGTNKKNGKNENDSLSSKTDSPPSKNGFSSSSSTALPMKPPSKPPSHSTSSANLRNNSISSTGSSTTVKMEPGIAMDQHSDFSDGHPSDELSSYLNYSSDFNEVTDQTFDHSVRSLERLLMPDGVRGSMDSTTSSNADSAHGGAVSSNEGPSDGFVTGSINSTNNSGIGSNSGAGNSISIKPPGSLAPITGVHSHSLIGASPGGSSGLVDGNNGSYASSSSGGLMGGQQTPTSLLNKGGVPSTGLVGYSPSGMTTNPDGSTSNGGVLKTTPLSSVHQHSTNPYSPYTPAVGGVSGMGGVGSTGACGLLGSSSGPGIAGLGNATGMLGLNVGGLHTNTIMPSNNPNGEYRVGAYTREERQMKIEMFRAKKRKRIWRKQIKYDCRKRLADTRPRVKGRFVSRKLGDNDDIAALMGGMLDDEMEGGMVGMGGVPGGMMDPTGMMILGGPGAAGMMMMGHPGGRGMPGAGGGAGGSGKSKKQLKNELQAMQIQQRYAAAVYGAAAGDPNTMMFMGVPGDPSQQMMYHMDYMNAGAAGGMLGMMGTGAGGDMSNPQLQGLLNFSGAFSPNAGLPGAAGTVGGAGGEQGTGLFLSSEQMLLKQQQQMMHTQHMLQQQQIYRDSLNLGASPFPNGLSSSGTGGNLLLSPNGAAAAAAANSNYLNSLSASGLNSSGLGGVGASIAGEGLLSVGGIVGGMQSGTLPDGSIKMEPSDVSTLDGTAAATTAPSLSAEGIGAIVASTAADAAQ